MTTFAGQMDFSGPQPFNVSIEAEEAPCQPMSAPVLDGDIPLAEQVITPDRDLYTHHRRGVIAQGKMHRG